MNRLLEELYEQIKHGDEHHQTWLHDKMEEFSNNEPPFKYMMTGAVEAGWPCAILNKEGRVHGMIMGHTEEVELILDQLSDGHLYDVNVPRYTVPELSSRWKPSPSGIAGQYRLSKSDTE